MPDPFELPVEYNEKEMLFPAELFAVGYTHKIKVTVEGIAIFFEPDEEKNYRAVLGDSDRDNTSKINPKLLQAISETLYELFGK